jgi:hypothetical protein
LEANILQDRNDLSVAIDRLIAFLQLYPVDLKIGIMKDMKNSYPQIYKLAIENEAFVEAYFAAYRAIR